MGHGKEVEHGKGGEAQVGYKGFHKLGVGEGLGRGEGISV